MVVGVYDVTNLLILLVYAVPYHTMPCHAMLRHAIPCFAIFAITLAYLH